jgi:hypothetical protein
MLSQSYIVSWTVKTLIHCICSQLLWIWLWQTRCEVICQADENWKCLINNFLGYWMNGEHVHDKLHHVLYFEGKLDYCLLITLPFSLNLSLKSCSFLRSLYPWGLGSVLNICIANVSLIYLCLICRIRVQFLWTVLWKVTTWKLSKDDNVKVDNSIFYSTYV